LSLSDSVRLYSSVVLIYLLTTRWVPGYPISYQVRYRVTNYPITAALRIGNTYRPAYCDHRPARRSRNHRQTKCIMPPILIEAGGCTKTRPRLKAQDSLTPGGDNQVVRENAGWSRSPRAQGSLLYSGVLRGRSIRGYTPYTNSGFFWQGTLTSVIINKQGIPYTRMPRPCVYPPPCLAIHHCF